MQSIINKFPISEAEYLQLDEKFGDLSHFQSWQLKKRNANNGFFDDEEDIVQNIRIAMLKAGSYYKRQTYIESSFESLNLYLQDPFQLQILARLQDLWNNRTRHGANRQKFGEFQEQILETLVQKCVPAEVKPDRRRPLVMDTKFVTYCKSITWNEQKLLGKKITRDRSFRASMVSLSEFDHICSDQKSSNYILA